MQNYLDLNREEINARIEEVKKQYSDNGLCFRMNPHFAKENKLHLIWYDAGDYAEIEGKRYKLNIQVSCTGNNYISNTSFPESKSIQHLEDYFKNDSGYISAIESGEDNLDEEKEIKINIYDKDNEQFIKTKFLSGITSILDIGYDRMEGILKELESMPENNAYTTKEVREMFLERARKIAEDWGNEAGSKEKCVAGAVFSILVMLDGEDAMMPAFKVSPICNKNDVLCSIMNGEKYFSEDTNIAGCLHELFYEK